LSPEMQIETVRLYGGLPLTPAARSAARSKILKDSDRTLEIAYASMKGKGASSVPHVADIDAVRIITNEELEAAWADKKPAKAALDTAVSRGNAYLNAHPAMKKAQPF
jgi:sn-glycerol 3-phosphate transport system substrate-binding protein